VIYRFELPHVIVPQKAGFTERCRNVALLIVAVNPEKIIRSFAVRVFSFGFRFEIIKKFFLVEVGLTRA
jgi:hypothetical protein